MRDTKSYTLAVRIVHLQEVLDEANCALNKHGLLGVIPDLSISFRKSSAFHAKVRKVLKNIV